MGRIAGTVALAALLAACGGKGGNSGSGNLSSSLYGLIRLLAHSPGDGAVQVPVDAAIRLEFDSVVALDSLGDEDTWLRRDDTGAVVTGRYSAADGGAAVLFTPDQPLARETDYTFQLSGLTCDNNGRLLDETVVFSFRTFDETPPRLLGVDVPNGATAHPRTGTFTFTFSEAIDPASLTAATLSLRDTYGFDYPATRTTVGNTAVLTPHADLPGSRRFALTLSHDVTDRAGNRFGTVAVTQFTTASDSVRPAVLTMWPSHGASGISPIVQPTYTFSESMDPGTVEPASLAFQDQFGSMVPFAIHSSADKRTLRVQPTVQLRPNRSYTLAFLLGAAATTDVSGNVLEATQALQFTTGADATPPIVVATTPTHGETRVSVNAILEVTFAEDLDAAWVDELTVRLAAGGELLAAVVEQPAPNVVKVTPVLELPTEETCTLTLRGGHEGLHDVAGNVMPADHTVTFTTTGDGALPRALIMPYDGATGVPTGAHVSIVFDAPMDPATMSAATIQVTDDGLAPVPGTLEVLGQNRIARFTPATDLLPSSWYRVRVAGGSAGVRRTSGSWFSTDRDARFRTGPGADTAPPTVTATLNGIDASRSAGLVLPPYGFTIDVRVTDPTAQSIDMSSVEVLLQGTAAGPGPATLFEAAVVDYSTFSVRVPAEAALGAGDWTMTVRAADLSGNTGTSSTLAFGVVEPSAGIVPFERVQVAWVRTDLDRDGSGTADFQEDLLRLGLGTAGDPIGANALLRSIVLDGVIAQANQLFGRGRRGEPLDAGSVWLRFTKREPIALPHMQMALGGFDPEGPRGRQYGAETTGVLGRAYYDHRNDNVVDNNTTTQPGLGVFPSEMWLYQSGIHEQSYPSYLTIFGQRFRPLMPAMGGVPAGSDPLDPIVLSPTFVYENGNASERARWLTIMQAADDWATVTGIILAHEVGHSVGLVATGPAPGGLFGDSSLHDTFAGAAEVMASAVGYEAMLNLDYHFRDIDLAYLRQRVLLR